MDWSIKARSVIQIYGSYHKTVLTLHLHIKGLCIYLSEPELKPNPASQTKPIAVFVALLGTLWRVQYNKAKWTIKKEIPVGSEENGEDCVMYTNQTPGYK